MSGDDAASLTMGGGIENGAHTQLLEGFEVEILQNCTRLPSHECGPIGVKKQAAAAEYAVRERGRCLVEQDKINPASGRMLQPRRQLANGWPIERRPRLQPDREVHIAERGAVPGSVRSKDQRVAYAWVGRKHATNRDRKSTRLNSSHRL